jgi:hypothetical protein
MSYLLRRLRPESSNTKSRAFESRMFPRTKSNAILFNLFYGLFDPPEVHHSIYPAKEHNQTD